MRTITEEMPQLTTVFSAFIIAGSFIFSSLDTPIFRLLGGSFFFLGLFGVAIAVYGLYATKLNELRETDDITNVLVTTIMTGIPLSLFVVSVFFIIAAFFESLESKSDFQFVWGGVVAFVLLFFCCIIPMYFVGTEKIVKKLKEKLEPKKK